MRCWEPEPRDHWNPPQNWVGLKIGMGVDKHGRHNLSEHVGRTLADGFGASRP